MTARTMNCILKHIDALNSPDNTIAVRAERNLIRCYGARALRQLISACSHENPDVRLRAVWILGHTGDPAAYESILQATRDPIGSVRYDAAIALGVLGDKRAIEPLIAMMSTVDVEASSDSAAAEGLARIGHPAAPALTIALRHPDKRVRIMAVRALANIRDETASGKERLS